MTTRNRIRLAHQRALRRRRRQTRHRRGVLLIVVLSMLVLFMMIGTAFLFTSSQYRTGAKQSAKLNRVGNHPRDLLDRALYQVLRDTNNLNSVVRFHSLLRDMYGADGFEAVVYRPDSINLAVPQGQATRYSAATNNLPLGPTKGQLIDIYVRDINVQSLPNPRPVPEPVHVIKLERDFAGSTVDHTLPLTTGYYNGTLLTISDGPGRGSSARIVDYQFMGDLPNNGGRLFRFRVVAFDRADAQPLAVNAIRSPELSDLAGARLVVNGRPFNGTGVGLDALAGIDPQTGQFQPRLTALEAIQIDGSNGPTFVEYALAPNAIYASPLDARHFAPDPNNPPPRPDNPFFGNPLSAYQALNPDVNTVNYGSYSGPGDTDESYDAPDFQNMSLAHETVTPRARGRLVVGGVPYSPDDPSQFGDTQRDYGAVQRLDLEDLPLPSFHRPALVNFWFHRLVDLAAGDNNNPSNQHVLAVLQPYGPDGIRNNNDDPTSVNLPTRDQIVALKRKFIMRPLREDHPNFDGSNPASRGRDWSEDETLMRNVGGTANIVAPFWESIGPWDVDNDNDGVADSVWIDLGDPVQQAEDGTLYKPLYAFKIVDLDSRLNVNAHGTADHINPPTFDPNRVALAGSVTSPSPTSSDFMPHGVGWGTADISLRPLFPEPVLDGTGPNGNPDGLADAGNRQESSLADGLRDPSVGMDDYATLLAGRLTTTGLVIPGRYGFDPFSNNDVDPLRTHDAAPGATTAAGYVVDASAQYRLFDYPLFPGDPSSFGAPPDLRGRYAVALDHSGQPTFEIQSVVENAQGRSLLADSPYELDLSAGARRDYRTDQLLVAYNATAGATEYYETTGVVSNSLNGFVIDTDDAPYAIADLERVLRAHDPDAGTIPSRLWDVVDAFDPGKLIFDPRFGNTPNDPSSLQLVAAEQQADINRRLVTTDSYDLPAPGQSLASRIAFGADGLPGLASIDDDNNGFVDDITELNTVSFANGSDDFAVVMAPFQNATPQDASPPVGGGLHDYLRYRVILSLLRSGVLRHGTHTIPQADALVNEVVYGTTSTVLPDNMRQRQLSLTGGTLLAPEVLAGLRMEINRPFGNGLDDDGNGVVDEPWENFRRGAQSTIKQEPLFSRAASGTMQFPGMPDEGIPYSHTNGQDVDNQPNRLVPVDGEDAELARQLYARHLFVLMLLLMDERYVASQSLENPNVELIVSDLVRRLHTENSTLPIDQLQARAEAMALRKLTIQRIAQWAINCVDYRDPDAIKTPFEYDENPFDGWGVWNQQGVFLPLDGKVGTDENWGLPEPHEYATVKGFERYANSQVPKKDPNPVGGDDASVEQATRGLVWGAERPELLITETFAFHDRRATDESDGATHWEIENPDQTLADDDLDQRLVPRGALFVELYNPWTPDGPKPAELYHYSRWEPGPFAGQNINPQDGSHWAYHTSDGSPVVDDSGNRDYEGVLLNRLSNARSSITEKYSPVWRMIAFKDAAAGRLTDRIALTDADLSNLALAKLRTIDPDGYGFESDKFAERYIYFTTGRAANAPLDRIVRGDDLNLGPGAGGASEYTTILNPVLENLNVHVPPLPLREVSGLTGPGPQGRFPSARRYFIAADRRQRNAPNARLGDAPIAPILPGRYAVIGPSGIQYTEGGNGLAIRPNTTTERYVTPVGRRPNQEDPAHTGYTAMSLTRRIELLPSRNPDLQQVFIDDNGGPEFVKLSDTQRRDFDGDGRLDKFLNVTDQDGDGEPDNDEIVFPLASRYVIPPAVAIPVEDLNVSEPPEGYPGIRYRQLSPDDLDGVRTSMNDAGELELSNANGTLIVDTPMDMEFELVRNGTTPNYCAIHLQRLANPLLPWNPPPYDQFGVVNPLHDPNLPVNPYTTIDSSSVDLTAFNGVSDAELDLPATKANAERQAKGIAEVTSDPLLQGIYFAPLDVDELKTLAPDYVIRELVKALVGASVLDRSWLTLPADQYRQRADTVIQSDLRQLEQTRRGVFAGALDADPSSDRQELLEGPHSFDHDGTQITGPWGWHRLRRFLPRYEFPTQSFSSLSSTDGGSNFRQYIHLKSLERGAHDRILTLEGWKYDPRWEPRLLWKRERPNGTVYLRNIQAASDPFPIRPMSDLVSSKNRALLATTDPTNLLTADDVEFHNFGSGDNRKWSKLPHVFDFAMQTTLGFANEAYAPELDFRGDDDESVMLKGTPVGQGAPQINTNANELDTNLEDKELYHAPYDWRREWLSTGTATGSIPITSGNMVDRRARLLSSTFPWLSWSDRPFISQMELLQVPASSSSRLLIDYSVIDDLTGNPYDGDGIDDPTAGAPMPESANARLGQQSAPFGHLLNFMMGALSPAQQLQDANSAAIVPYGAPNYSRILEFVQVRSPFVNSDAFLNPLDFSGTGTTGAINGSDDPRRHLQPPFNRISHFREPGRVNLNMVAGRRIPANENVPPQLWSEVYDGIMHRLRDGERYVNNGGALETAEGAHFGPAWRDVVLSRRGYAHFYLNRNFLTSMDKTGNSPDAFSFGLNRNFPTFFANPFRSPDAGDLVPLTNMVQLGVNASVLRAHPFNKGVVGLILDRAWGDPQDDDDLAHNGTTGAFPVNIAANSVRRDDTREAGFGNDLLSAVSAGSAPDNQKIPNIFDPTTPPPLPPSRGTRQSRLPLFSESLTAPHVDAERNPFFFYQPLTRLGNLATTRSGVFAIWITVGYFEVEPAPRWTDVGDRFGQDRDLYDRVYPEGYQLGREMGIDTGNVRRQRGFYIVDRTLPVGFKPGDDLNVEQMIRLRRRIE